MKLSANEEYGVLCLVRLGYASFEGQGLTIPEISQAEGVSPAYAAKILRDLRKGGFVKAARGKDGGYTLARPAEEILIGDVVDLLGGRLFESDFCDSHSGQAAICTRSRASGESRRNRRCTSSCNEPGSASDSNARASPPSAFATRQ